MKADDPAPAPLGDCPGEGRPRPESEALWQKVEQYRPYLKAVAERILAGNDRIKTREDASDVVQKALVRGYVARDQFQGKTSDEFLAWLVRIVRNVACNTIRDGHALPRDVQREQALPEDGPGGRQLSAGSSTPSRKAARKDEIVRVLAAVDRLPAAEQEVVRLHALEELSYEEVAKRLGITRDVVRGRWQRGLEALCVLLRKSP